MTSVEAAEAITALSTQAAAPARAETSAPSSQPQPSEASRSEIQGPSFAELIANGLAAVEAKIDAADAQVRAFALDDSIPIHQVTIALEEARIAVELAAQVRDRIVDGYREIMSMQL